MSTFLKVADLLNVSTDYLLRGHEFGRVEKIDDELFALVTSLNQQHKSELKGYITRMLEEESVAAEEGQKPQKWQNNTLRVVPEGLERSDCNEKETGDAYVRDHARRYGLWRIVVLRI